MQSSFMTANLVYDPLWTVAIAVLSKNYYKLYNFNASIVIAWLLLSSHSMELAVSNLFEILENGNVYRNDILYRIDYFDLHMLNI